MHTLKTPIFQSKGTMRFFSILHFTGANASQDGSKKDATQEDLLGIAGEGCAICVFVGLLY